jgi:N-acetylglucosaminyldiphosphoundecaprenol N-acetyl-beta-D-mannosaminyltransferase
MEKTPGPAQGAGIGGPLESVQANRSRAAPTHATCENIPRANILGVGVSAINIPMALQVIDSWVTSRNSNYVTVTPVHGVMEAHRDESLRRIFNSAGLVTPDGMPLVWLSRRQGFPWVERVYGPDLMLAVCGISATRHYRHFFYGGNPGVAERLRDRLVERFPGLDVAGVHTPPFRPLSAAEDDEVIETINRSGADIIWVGISTPKQERWMAAHLGRINSPVMIGVGAAFDFHAGLKKQAPRWMQRSGLEWLFRLMSEPRRLWKRYLIYNPWFVALVFGQISGIKKYHLDDPPKTSPNLGYD